jgi:hypothetical protein
MNLGRMNWNDQTCCQMMNEHVAEIYDRPRL